MTQKQEQKNRGGRPRKHPARRTAFGAWIKKSRWSVNEIADSLDVTPSSIYAMASGKWKPGRDLAVRISELTKGAVDAADW